MKTLLNTRRYPLVAEIENLSVSSNTSLDWFKDFIRNLLESPKETYTKVDAIALSVADVDARISYIADEIKSMTALKKRLTLAKNMAQEMIAEVMAEYGVSQVEGVAVSSLSITPEKRVYKERIRVKDGQENKLLEMGYVDFTVDLDSIATDIKDMKKMKELDDYISVDIEEKVFKAKVRINKKRSSNVTQADKLVELIEAA